MYFANMILFHIVIDSLVIFFTNFLQASTKLALHIAKCKW